MCGIIGAVSKRDITKILLEGLHRLEYRGYDSAGIAVIDYDKQLKRLRALGKVQALGNAMAETPIAGTTGIAHTRWATHGKPSEQNAHPHTSYDGIAVVHNGTMRCVVICKNLAINFYPKPTAKSQRTLFITIINKILVY